MQRFFLGNFDFEHQLASEVYATSVSATPALNATFACCWLGLAEVGDQISLAGDIPPDFVSHLEEAGLPRVTFTPDWPRSSEAAERELVPWGWSNAVRQLAAEKGFVIAAPDAAAVQTVNARTFSFACEQEYGVALHGSRQVNDLGELEAAVRTLPEHPTNLKQSWVIKANFSMSARERMLGQGTQIPEPVKNWATKRFAIGQPLFLEPWVNRTAEAGLQFFIPREGPPEWLGLTPLVCDERGQYRGSRLTIDAQTQDEWRPAIEVGQRVAQRVQQAGYFGPLGIDAMRYADARGTLHWRPIQDVNARYTMGRVALGFSRFIKPTQSANWLHLPWKESYGIRFSNWLRCHQQQSRSETRLIATAPDQINEQTVRLVNLLLISETDEQLFQAEAELLRAVTDLTESTN